MFRQWSLHLNLAVAILCLTAIGAQAQPSTQGQKPSSAQTVIASTSNEEVRFAALAGATELRLEVFTAAGEKVFDSDFNPGNLLDWALHNQQGQRLTDGAYRCVITARDLTGQPTQKHGEILLQAGGATFQSAGDDGQMIQTTEARNLVSRDAMLSVLRDGMTRATTVLAHDGSQGRLVSASGGLSFRTGDFFAGKDVEQMRLTHEGNLGIGVSKPTARLDVAGIIRTSEGLMFPDGTIQTTAANPASRSWDDRGSRTIQPQIVGEKNVSNGSVNLKAPTFDISGTGITNRLTKWVNGPNGVVGDSTLTEVGGNVGIGTSTPAARLHLVSSDNPTVMRIQSSAGFGAGRVEFWSDAPGSVSEWRPSFMQSTDNGGFTGGLAFFVNGTGSGNRTGQVETMRLVNGGVGIGTSTPGQRLAVRGAESTSHGFGAAIGLSNAAAGGGNWYFRTGATGTITPAGGFSIADDVDYRLVIHKTGNVGIGTLTPSAKLEASASNSTAVKGVTTLLGGIGVHGINKADKGSGVQGDASTDVGAGVSGNNTVGYGVVGVSTGQGGTGVYGTGPGTGVSGSSTNGTGVSGNSTNGVGVYGASNKGTGVKGTTSAISDAGVIGTNNSDDPDTYGVIGSSTGVGVLGWGAVYGVLGINPFKGPGVTGLNYKVSHGPVGGFLGGHNGVYAGSEEEGKLNAALRAENYRLNDGVAAYLYSQGTGSTAHLFNGGAGEVIRLQASGGSFIRAVNKDESKTVFSVNYDGTTVTNVLQITGGADFAEQFEVSEAPKTSETAPALQIQPGLIVSIDPANPGKLIVSSQSYDRRVAGIISGAGGVKPGMMMSQSGSIADGSRPVALTGRVYCWADASNGPIEPGDLLTTSPIPGHAMKATDQTKAQGAIIGKAMTSLKKGKGLVLVLVSLQ